MRRLWTPQILLLSRCLFGVADLAKIKFTAKLWSDRLAKLTTMITSPQLSLSENFSISLNIFMWLLGVWIAFQGSDNFYELRQRNSRLVLKNPGLAGNYAVAKEE